MNNYILSLETERLLLRNLEPGDKEFLLRLWTDPEVTRFMGGPRDRASLLQALEGNIRQPFREEYDLWIVTEKISGEPVGHCGLLEKAVEAEEGRRKAEGVKEGRRKVEKEIEVIYVIAKEYWGRGYATEIAGKLMEYAFTKKHLNRVIALIKPANKASEQVARKCGMGFEREVVRGEGIRMFLYAKEHG